MVPTDKKSRWKESLLNDPRVEHYWDEEKKLGRWVTQNVQDCKHLGPVDWDSFFLFDGDGVWGDSFEGVKACGTPVIRETETLQLAIETLFEKSSI